MPVRLARLLLCGLCALPLLSWAGVPRYQVSPMELPYLRTLRSYADLNDAGVAVGSLLVRGHSGGEASLKFWFDGQTLVTTDPVEVYYGTGSVTGLNNLGYTTGFYFSDGGYDRRSYVTLGLEGPTQYLAMPYVGHWNDLAIARAINNHNHLVGEALLGDNRKHAILWTAPDQWQDLGTMGGEESQALAINDQGMITGQAAGVAFLYQDGVMQPLAGLETTTSRGNAINASGDIAGYVGYDGSYERQAFVHIDGQVVLIDNPPGLASEAQDINDAGWVVGTLYGNTTPGAAAGGFLYVDGQMIDVSTLLDPASGWLVRQANDINDRNQIWAEVCRGTDCQWALLTPVPEPAHWSMLALGLPPVAALAWRRRAARTS